MAVSHQSPKQQRGEGYRGISETPPGLSGDHDDPVFHGSNAPVSRKGMNLTSKGGQPKRPLRSKGYAYPRD